jgi:hypothetical protein
MGEAAGSWLRGISAAGPNRVNVEVRKSDGKIATVVVSRSPTPSSCHPGRSQGNETGEKGKAK